MRIVLLILSLFCHASAIRFLFASELFCEYDEDVFEFKIAYFNGDEQISTERHLSARGSLFFFHEGAAESIENPEKVHAVIEHDCNENGDKMEVSYYFSAIDSEKVVQRIDYKLELADQHGEIYEKDSDSNEDQQFLHLSK
ncbi:hypothetical protein L5515_015207 [Caenorhabditis briggsae]|uniref:Uncharacterized protein n=1 Tax=Caenorhabditis briggsae TaxID=6238 RepID=A0AAE9J8J0_CAEBR|nr:hypothetical protein L5515_015207 [Caenorhabditis briggsae]